MTSKHVHHTVNNRQFINVHSFSHGFPHGCFFHMFPSFSETPSLPPRLSASAGTSCTSCASGTSGRVCQCDPSCCSQSRSSCGTTRRRSREIFSSPENIHLTCSEHLYIPPKVLKMPGKKHMEAGEPLLYLTNLIYCKFYSCGMEMKFVHRLINTPSPGSSSPLISSGGL
jgi:hypothetical protein